MIRDDPIVDDNAKYKNKPRVFIYKKIIPHDFLKNHEFKTQNDKEKYIGTIKPFFIRSRL